MQKPKAAGNYLKSNKILSFLDHMRLCWFFVGFLNVKELTGLLGRVFGMKMKPWEYSTIVISLCCSFGFTGAAFADVWPGLKGADSDDAFGLSERKGS